MSVWLMIPRDEFEALFPDQANAYEALGRLGGHREEHFTEEELREYIFQAIIWLRAHGLVDNGREALQGLSRTDVDNSIRNVRGAVHDILRDRRRNPKMHR